MLSGSRRSLLFTPTGGNGTTTVTITGKNFNNTTDVTFGICTGVPKFIVNSSTTTTAIHAYSSTGADGNVSVTTPFGIGLIELF